MDRMVFLLRRTAVPDLARTSKLRHPEHPVILSNRTSRPSRQIAPLPVSRGRFPPQGRPDPGVKDAARVRRFPRRAAAFSSRSVACRDLASGAEERKPERVDPRGEPRSRPGCAFCEACPGGARAVFLRPANSAQPH